MRFEICRAMSQRPSAYGREALRPPLEEISAPSPELWSIGDLGPKIHWEFTRQSGEISLPRVDELRESKRVYMYGSPRAKFIN